VLGEEIVLEESMEIHGTFLCENNHQLNYPFWNNFIFQQQFIKTIS